MNKVETNAGGNRQHQPSPYPGREFPRPPIGDPPEDPTPDDQPVRDPPLHPEGNPPMTA
jgi:hypothetical protein